MATSLVVILLIAGAGYTLAVPVDSKEVLIDEELFSSMENDANALDDLNFSSEEILPSKEVTQNDNHCTDFYSFTCSKNRLEVLKNYSFNENLATTYTLLMPVIKHILNGEYTSEGKSLAIEQQLYEKCINLWDESDSREGNEISAVDENYYKDDPEKVVRSEQNWFSIDRVFNDMLKNYNEKINESTWQDLDDKLASLGFERTFFRISVTNDFTNLNKNIILLEPPSIIEWNSKRFTDLLSDIFVKLQTQAYTYCNRDNLSSSEEQANSDFKESSNEIDRESPFLKSEEIEVENINDSEKPKVVDKLCEPYKYYTIQNAPSLSVKLINEDDINTWDIFNTVLKSIFDSIDITNKEPLDRKMTIKEWTKVYNKFIKNKKNVSKLNWSKIIKDEFKHIGIPIHDDEPIIIKNVPYFRRMANSFRFFNDSTLAHAVRSKFVADNIRYYDYDWTQSANPVSRSEFCSQETKLYGVSQKLQEYIEEKMKPYTAKAQKIQNNVVKVLYSKIDNSEKLSPAKKEYLKTQLAAITKNAFETNVDTNFVSNYYGTFKLSGDYFADINLYRRMIKIKELRRLRDPVLLPYQDTPFSITELENPRNRFFLYSVLSVIATKFLTESEPPVTEETFYATYAVNTANFLYSILTEDLLESDLSDRHGVQWLVPHTAYTPTVVKCFVPENIVSYGYNLAYTTITEIFGVRIALQSMLKDSESYSVKNFFNAYVAIQCENNNKKVTRKVLYNVKEFSEAFNCSNVTSNNEMCKWTPF